MYHKLIITLLLFCSITFGQSELPILFEDDEAVYALNLAGTSENAYILNSSAPKGFAITESEYLRSSNGILLSTITDIAAHWVLDSIYNSRANESFETFTGTANDGNEDDFAGWTESADARTLLEAVTTDPYLGTYCIKSTSTSASASYFLKYFTITPYDSLRVSFWIKANVTGAANEAYYQIYSRDNGANSNVTALTTIQPTGNVWTNYSYTFKAGNYDTVSIAILPCKGVGSICYLDAVTIVRYNEQDKSANANDLVFAGTKAYGTDNPVTTGTAQYFDGSGEDYYYIPSADATDFDFGTGSWSISYWVKTDVGGIAVSKHLADNNYFMGVSGGVPYVKIASGGSATSLYGVDDIRDNKWHKMDITCNPDASINLYLDGTLEATATLSGYNIATSGSDFVIGNLETDTGAEFAFTGYISEVRVVGRVLTATEVYNEYYRFNEIGFDNEWTNAGNHTIDTTTTSPHAGTYSGSLVATGIGSASTNYVSLPIRQSLIAGSKYLIQLYTKTLSDIGEVITVVIGDKSFTINPTTSFARYYLHFLATASTVNQPIKIYCDQATTVIIDNLTIKKKYDLAVMAFFKTSSNSDQVLVRFDGSVNQGYYLKLNNPTDQVVTTLRDEYTTSTNIARSSSVFYSDTWNLAAFTLDWTGNGSSYFNDGTPATSSLAAVGNIRYNINLQRLEIADFNSGQGFNGLLGEVQIIRFDDIGSFNPITYYNAGKLQSSYTGGTIVAWYNWAGADLLNDRGSLGNNLGNTGIDITDQVKVGTKYK